MSAAVLTSVPVRAPEHAYLHLVRLVQSLQSRSSLPALVSEPSGLPCTSSASLSPWSVSPAPEPPALPASLLPGQSRLSAPAPGPTGYHCHSQEIYYTFLVAVDLFSSARTSQDRRMRCRVGGLGRRRRH